MIPGSWATRLPLGSPAAEWAPEPEGRRKGPRGGAGKLGGLRAPLAGRKKPGSGRAGVGRIAAGGVAGEAVESGNSPEIPFHSRIPRPFPWVRTPPSPGKGKMKYASGRLAFLRQLLAVWVWSARGSPVTATRRSSGPSRGRGVCPVPGGSWVSGALCRSVPERGEASPDSFSFSLSWCHMSRGGVETRGVGGGVCAGRGPPSPPICAAARLTDARNSQ